MQEAMNTDEARNVLRSLNKYADELAQMGRADRRAAFRTPKGRAFLKLANRVQAMKAGKEKESDGRGIYFE